MCNEAASHSYIYWLYSTVDDPLDTVAIHFGGGFWGLISASVFSNTGLVFGITRESLMVRTVP
jgi:ammonia channel protein AmtB